MAYRVVYDAAHEPPAFMLFLVVGAIVLGVMQLRLVDRIPELLWRGPFRSNPGLRRPYAVLWLAISVVVGTVFGIAVLVPYAEAQTALATGRVTVIEGVVEAFEPMPPRGRGAETFRVGNIRFSYNDYDLTPGFHRTARAGGPIRDGLPVRVTYAGPPWRPTILRLEVAEAADPQA